MPENNGRGLTRYTSGFLCHLTTTSQKFFWEAPFTMTIRTFYNCYDYAIRYAPCSLFLIDYCISLWLINKYHVAI